MVGGIGFIVFLLLRSFVVEGAYYKVQTQTGGSDGAGTDAKVFIRIFGVGGVKQTSRHELDTNGDDDFEKGNLDTFDINDNTDVGMPEYIKIYRKRYALFGNWQLSWIRVTHNGKEFLFPYYGWVAHSRWIKINVKGKPPGLKLVSDDSSVGAYYKVQTQTGSSDGAGTDAKVFIRIFGVGGVKQTSRHELDTNGDDDFEEGNLDTFDVNDNTDVGMPEYIKIYRKSHAFFGNWQLSWIRVTHNGKEFLFPYYGWVAHSRWIKINGKCKPPGLELASNDSCVDVNECATSPCKENSVCKNLVGSFKCECNDGYKPKDQLSCEDINECIGDSHKCNYKTSECVNTPGEYHCKCNSGFKKVSRYECKDKNECVEGSHTCNTTSSKCVNLHGDFYCKCKTGYHQTDSMKLCMRDECAPLARPYKSIIEPARCTQNRANYYGDVCTVRCENGYVLENPNLNSVSCSANGKWNTNTPRCTAVKCPALLAPTNGRLLPSSCLTEGNKYQGQCTYICNKGYQLSGSPVRECRAEKTWTGSKPTCIKVVVKPWIRCPIDIMVNLAPGQKTADVSSLWKEPSYLGEILLVDPPTANAKFRFPAGETKITWTTRNAAGSDSCSILVMVYDKENPKIVTPCPASPVGVLTTTSSATVTWQEPAFSDNVGVTKVTSTRKSGEVFGLGSWNVYYTAYDKAGNTATCEFVVTVKIQGCPELKGPYGGDRKCSSFGQIKYCTITCPSDKQIYKNPSPYSVWTCNSAKWDPTPAVPDCVAAALKDDSSCTGNQVEMAIAFSSGSKTYCADCPRGTYSSNGKCKPCAAGQYQDQQGSATCKDCASGTSSLAGANDVKQCRVVCRPGHYSVDGMDPGCQLCPKNTYQNNPKATSCIPCPAGTTTLSLGMSKLSHCGAKPVITSVTPKTKTIDERQSTSISCYVTGSPTPSITLKFRRNISAGFLGQETREFLRDSNGKVIGIKLTITGATYENSGNYECSAENPFGKVVELSTLTVNQVFGSGADASFDVDDLI